MHEQMLSRQLLMDPMYVKSGPDNKFSLYGGQTGPRGYAWAQAKMQQQQSRLLCVGQHRLASQEVRRLHWHLKCVL